MTSTTMHITAYVPVEPENIAFVMGKNGRTMMGVARKHNVVITYKPYNPIYSPDIPPSFMIKGHPVNVNSAGVSLREISFEHTRRRWMSSYQKTKNEAILKVEADDIGMLIGSGGKTIRTLASNHQVEAFVPKGQKGNATVNVVFRGYKMSVSAAISKAQEIIDEGRRRRGANPKYDLMDDSIIIDLIRQNDKDFEESSKLYHNNPQEYEANAESQSEGESEAESSDEEIEVICV